MLKRKQITLPGVVLLAALLSVVPRALAGAQTPEAGKALTSDLEALRVVTTKKGQEVFISADEAGPGDVLEYRVTYTNHTPRPIRDLVATLPIPVGLEYLGESASPRRAQASLDEVEFKRAPLVRRVRRDDGASVTVEVPLQEYRAIRWKIPSLAGGKSVIVKARARVASTD